MNFLFKEIKQIELTKFPRLTYADALRIMAQINQT